MSNSSFRLLVKHTIGHGPPKAHAFAQDRVSIGRAVVNDIVLSTPMRLVSRHHAEIRRQAGAFWLIDLGSKNRTTLNGQPLEAEHLYRLRPGDLVQVGNFKLELEMPHRGTGEVPTQAYARVA